MGAVSRRRAVTVVQAILVVNALPAFVNCTLQTKTAW